MDINPLRGGPLDGHRRTSPYRMKVAMGWDYGWKYSCGEPAYAVGVYNFDGTWSPPERDVVLDELCPACEEDTRMEEEE